MIDTAPGSYGLCWKPLPNGHCVNVPDHAEPCSASADTIPPPTIIVGRQHYRALRTSRDEFIRALGNVLSAYDHEVTKPSLPVGVHELNKANVADARKLYVNTIEKKGRLVAE